MKKIAFIIFFLFISVSSGVFANTPNDFENKTVGMKLTKLDNWNFTYSNENAVTNPAQIVKIKKQSEFQDGFNSVIDISIQSNEALVNNDPKATLENIIIKMQSFFPDTQNRERIIKEMQAVYNLTNQSQEIIRENLSQENFKVLQMPIDATIGGLNASYVSFKHVISGKSIISQIWLVPNGNDNFFIMTITNQNDIENDNAQLKQIIDSIVIMPTFTPVNEIITR